MTGGINRLIISFPVLLPPDFYVISDFLNNKFCECLTFSVDFKKICIACPRILNIIITTVEPRYIEVGYNKTLL